MGTELIQTGVEEIWDEPWKMGEDGERTLLALVVRAADASAGPTEGAIRFVTPPTSPLQLAFMTRGENSPVPPHYHVSQQRPASPATEVLFIRSGEARVRFYGFRERGLEHAAETILQAGDWIILIAGGHSIDFPGPCDIAEVKLGPYSGRESDKREFLS